MAVRDFEQAMEMWNVLKVSTPSFVAIYDDIKQNTQFCSETLHKQLMKD